MAIEQTLNRVERDIASGDYGRARDRLHGLIATYPNDLALRRKLGVDTGTKTPTRGGMRCLRRGGAGRTGADGSGAGHRSQLDLLDLRRTGVRDHREQEEQ
jgi:hypothetical protein